VDAGVAAKGGGPETADYSKCDAKFEDKYGAAETKAGSGVCASEGDVTGIQDFLSACDDSVMTTVTTGAALPLDPITCASDLSECDTALAATDSCAGDLTACNGSLGTCIGSLATCTGDLATANAGTAAVGDVLSGETFTSTVGLGATGTMPNNGAVTLTPTTSDQAIAAGYHDGAGECAGDADLLAANIKNGVNLFGVTGTVGVLQKTGQTACYNTAGSTIACAGTGQDGELQKGAARSVTDNGNGTVTDNLTGLMWEKQSDDGSIHDKDNTYTWDNAFASKVASLNSTVFAGHNDWRVPNIVELLSLVNYAVITPATFSEFNASCTATCTVLTCSCTSSEYYWSSDSNRGGPASAWDVAFYSGNTGTGGKTTTTHRVRAVRAGF
jgi:hypothetical protein